MLIEEDNTIDLDLKETLRDCWYTKKELRENCASPQVTIPQTV